MAAISQVFATQYVAEKVGEDEEWLWDLQIKWIRKRVAAYGIERLKQIIANERAADRAPPRVKSTK